jgi:hypothetical protein
MAGLLAEADERVLVVRDNLDGGARAAGAGMKFYIRTFNPFRRYFWVCEYNTFHRMLRVGPFGVVFESEVPDEG